MSKEKVLYFRKQKDLDNIKATEIRSYEKDTDSNMFIHFDIYKLGIKTKIDDSQSIKGYITISKKSEKYEKQPLKNISASIDGKVAIHKKREADEEIIGYVIINQDAYGVVRKTKLGIISSFIVLAALCISLGLIIKNNVISNDNKKVAIEDQKGTGLLDDEKIDYSTEGFRFKINTTPIISDGKMNVRIVSPEAENKNFVAVYEYQINAKVDVNDNVIEKYDEPINLYKSSEIYGNENLEYATPNVQLEEGYYSGICYCTVYDKAGNKLTVNGSVIRVYCAD